MRPFDTSWRERALAGDAAAVRRLADELLRPLHDFCLHRLGGDRHLTEEVVQETLLRAYRDLESYEPERAGDRIFRWVTGLARNEIKRVLRRERRSTELTAAWAQVDRRIAAVLGRIEEEEFGAELLVRQETRELVNTTMSQLPPRYRTALEARYVEGLTVRALAERDSVSLKAAESLLARARQAFRGTFVALTRPADAEPAL